MVEINYVHLVSLSFLLFTMPVNCKNMKLNLEPPKMQQKNGQWRLCHCKGYGGIFANFFNMISVPMILTFLNTK